MLCQCKALGMGGFKIKWKCNFLFFTRNPLENQILFPFYNTVFKFGITVLLFNHFNDIIVRFYIYGKINNEENFKKIIIIIMIIIIWAWFKEVTRLFGAYLPACKNLPAVAVIVGISILGIRQIFWAILIIII